MNNVAARYYNSLPTQALFDKAPDARAYLTGGTLAAFESAVLKRDADMTLSYDEGCQARHAVIRFYGYCPVERNAARGA
jgi:hypothetical protein